VFASSPIQVFQTYAILKNKVPSVSHKNSLLANIAKLYTDQTPPSVSQLLPGTTLKQYDLKAYNIGKASCQYINFNTYSGSLHSLSAFFDIGYPLDDIDNPDLLESHMKEIGKKSPNIVIISHYDADHYLGVAYANPKIYDKIWIGKFPDKHTNMSALRLIYNLVVKGKIWLIDHKCNGTCFFSNHDKSINLYKGRGRYGVVNSNNNSGIILEIKGQKQEILLLGDCEYNELPNIIKDKTYDLIQVPHHGSLIRSEECWILSSSVERSN